MFKLNQYYQWICISITFFIFIEFLLINASEFKIYWNVPTFMCHRYGMKFEEVSKIYNMIQNTNDEFRGDKIAILYHPGNIPSYVQSFDENSTIISNGRVPQKGNLEHHLQVLQQDLSYLLSSNFSGLGVLDYERWRPIFRQNWSKLRPAYQVYSIDIEKGKFPILTKTQAKLLAKKALEYGGRIFLEETIKLVKKHHALALWTFYDYPKCYNLTPKTPSAQCDDEVREENDKMSWLWDESDFLAPSIYIATFHVNTSSTRAFIAGRLSETHRVSMKYTPPKPILAYLRYRYKDAQDTFLNQQDYIDIFAELLNQGINGVIIWGSNVDVNTREKCINLLTHLNHIMVPAVNLANELYICRHEGYCNY